MSILITGGTGFIGAEVARQLLDQGELALHVMHRRGQFQRLRDIAGRINFIECDLGDEAGIFRAIEKTQPDTIYHLGAMLTGPGEADPQAALRTNALGTQFLLEAARLFEARQFLFSSSIGAYGADLRGHEVTDYTVQRPFSVYGVTKVFGELLGAYYQRRYGLDFRGLRYPSIVGPGVRTPSLIQYTSWVLERPARGEAITIAVRPDTAAPIMYYKDAARAIIQLGQAPAAQLKLTTYLVDGVKPAPTAGQLADLVRTRVPGAQIRFEPDPALQALVDQVFRPIDDSPARQEWSWQPAYGLEAMLDDFLAELQNHPDRYH